MPLLEELWKLLQNAGPGLAAGLLKFGLEFGGVEEAEEYAGDSDEDQDEERDGPTPSKTSSDPFVDLATFDAVW